MKKLRNSIILTLALLLALSGGCAFRSPTELLSLPSPPQEFSDLQSVIDEVRDSGAEYSAPVAGTRRQSVQLVDVNGDGEEEAVVFFKKSDEERPLKIYIFGHAGDKWRAEAIIEGEGTAFDRVAFSRLTSDSSLFLAVGRHISGSFTSSMSVYSLNNLQPVEIGSFNYDALETFDVDGDGVSELIAVVSSDSVGRAGTVCMYKHTGAAVELISESPLSLGAGALRVVKTGYLSDKSTTAMFVISAFATGIVTDVLAWRDGELKNIRLMNSGISETTVVDGSCYVTDINDDMILEVPLPRALESDSTLANSTGRVYLRWYCYAPSGAAELVLCTYHNDADGWYLDLTDVGTDIIVNHAEITTGEKTVALYSRGEDGQLAELATIYTLSGDNRFSRATVGHRFRLMEKGDVIYAARLPQLEDSEAYEAARASLMKAFHLISREWDTGVIG